MHCEGMRPLTYIDFVHLWALQMWAKTCSQHKLCCCTLSVGRMHLPAGVLLHMASSMAFAVKSAQHSGTGCHDICTIANEAVQLHVASTCTAYGKCDLCMSGCIVFQPITTAARDELLSPVAEQLCI